MVYDDALQNGFADWGWAPDRDFATASPVHSGTHSISFSSDSTWQGITLAGNVDSTLYDALLVWVRGSAANLQYDVRLQGAPTTLALKNYTGGAIPNGSWALATIPFADFGLASGGGSSAVVFQAEGAQGTIYLDDISLRAATIGTIAVNVDPYGAKAPVNPLIFGVAHFDDAGSSQLAYPARRWGGNATTRYNWEIDVQNHASDYFFFNIVNSVANPSQLPNNSTADLWVDSVKAHGGEPVLTVPTIGWAPKGSNPNTDRVKAYGMSIAKYGAQRQNECQANNYVGCSTDAGDGCTPSSPPGTCTFITPLVPLDPTDTSKAVTPSYFVSWLNHIAGRVGNAANGGVKYLVLDNEPMLWDSTHHDVHPQYVTYDELWQKDRDSAAAFKANDPNVRVLAGAAWGWCEYFASSKDTALYGGCGPGGVLPSNDPGGQSDYATHGNMLWLPYLLQQGEAWRLAHGGTRLFDYLDVHYYPQANGVFSPNEGDAAAQALRLRSLRSLWDPTYTDESWVGTPVQLVPRMKAMIAQWAPGTKLAINEYNFGDGNGASSALAQAEALAIFAKYGVDMANRWVVPPAGSLIEDAFKLYLNYDGAGAKVKGDSVPATSTYPSLVSAYAIRDVNALYVLLFNKDTSARSPVVTLGGVTNATASLYRVGATPLASAGTASVTAGSFTPPLPARTATLAVVPFVPAGVKYYAVTPCRVVDTRNANGPFGGPAFANGTVRTFAIASSACGVPGTARAVALNVTTVPFDTGAFKVTPGGTAAQPATTIPFMAGRTRANNTTVGTSDDGTASIAVTGEMLGGTAHLIVDVSGYFQ